MRATLKIFITLLGTLILSFLFLATFFGGGTKGIATQLGVDLGEGKYMIEQIDSGYAKVPFKEGKENIIIDRFSPLDTIFVSNDSNYSVENEVISLNKGIFLIEFGDYTKNYRVKGKGFEASISTPGKVYFDISNPNKPIIISQNVTFDLKLLNESGVLMTTMQMYPHLYISMNVALNKNLKNVDIVRIDTLQKIGYLTGSFYTSRNAEEVFGFMKDTSGFSKFIDFFEITKEYIHERHKNIEKEVEALKNANTIDFPGREKIEEYKILFLNNEKKKAYLLNIYISEVVSFLSDKNSNTDKLIALQEEIEQIEGAHKDLLDLQYKIVYLLSRSVDTSMVKRYLEYAVASNLASEETSRAFNSLAQLYNLYDTEGIYEYDYLDTFLSNISTINNSDVSKQKIGLGYLRFFLEKILLSQIRHISNETNVSDKQIHAVLTILGEYSNVLGQFYSLEDDPKSISTSFNSTISVISNLDSLIKNVIFSGKNSQGILIKGKYVLSESESDLLIDSSNNLFKYFDKYFITEDDDNSQVRYLKKTYPRYKEKYDEYYFAIDRYDDYLLEKNTFTSSLLGGDDEATLESVTSEQIVQEFSKFTGLTIEEKNIEIFNNKVVINDALIGSTPFSFTLRPYAGNIISSIKLDDVSYSRSYRLKDYEGSGYKDFFINTILALKNNKNATIIENKSEENEVKPEKKEPDSAEVRIFKRDQLPKELSQISDVLKIRYNDIEVKEKDDAYQVILRDSPLNIGGKEFNLQAEFVRDSRPYYFKDIFIYSDSSPKVQVKNLTVSQLKVKLNGFPVAYTNLQQVDEFIRNKNIEKIKYYYNLDTQKILVEGIKSDKKVQFLFDGSNFSDINIGFKNVYSKSINISDISRLGIMLGK